MAAAATAPAPTAPASFAELVPSLRAFSPSQLGSSDWRLQQLTLQHLLALAAVSEGNADIIAAHFASQPQQFGVLVHQLLSLELFRSRVLPALLPRARDFSLTKLRYVVNSEAAVASLVDLLLTHKAVVGSLSDLERSDASSSNAAASSSNTSSSTPVAPPVQWDLIDLVDWCARKLTLLAQRDFKDIEEKLDENETAAQGIERWEKLVSFGVALHAVKMLRSLTEQIQQLPFSALVRMLDTHDVVGLLVPLLENPPWQRLRNGKLEKYDDNEWKVIPAADRLQLTKLEVWQTLYNLLIDEACVKHYKYDTARKENVLRLRRFFNEVLIDQLPHLKQLHRYVEQLQLVDPPRPTSVFRVVEEIAEMQPRLIGELQAEVDGLWESVYPSRSATLSSLPAPQPKIQELSSAELITLQQRSQARRKDAEQSERKGQVPTETALALFVERALLTDANAPFRDDKSTRQIESMQMMFELTPLKDVCWTCHKIGDTKRCSRCKAVWYCSPACQNADWSEHKQSCTPVAAINTASSSAPASPKPLIQIVEGSSPLDEVD